MQTSAIQTIAIRIAMLAALQVHAANLTWNGGVSGTWQNGAGGWLDGGTAANWNNATPDAATFAGTAPTAVSIHSGGITVGNLGVTAGSYTLGGTGTLTLSGGAFTVANALTTTVTSALAGTTGLTKAGAGTLVLSGANKNYTGTTTIQNGAVQITGVAAGYLGSSATGTVALDGGALQALFSANTTVGYVIDVGAGGGTLRNLGNDSQRWVLGANDKIRGSGVLTIAFGSSNTRLQLQTTSHPNFTGKWIVDSGGSGNRVLDMGQANVNLGAASGDDALTLRNTGTLLLRGSTLGSSTQGITIGSGGAKIVVAGGLTGIIAGKLSGAAGNPLELYGENSTSIIALSNPDNAWLGATSLNGGSAGARVRADAAGVFPSAGGTVGVSSVVVLDLNGFSQSLGGLTGAGTVTNSTGTAVLTVGGNNLSTSFTGSVRDGAGSLSLVKTGTGTLTFGGANAYSGSTTVTGGGVQWNQPGLAPEDDLIVSSGVTLTLNYTQTNTVHYLVLDGRTLAPRVYHSGNAPTGLTISGTGAIRVTDYIPSETMILLR